MKKNLIMVIIASFITGIFWKIFGNSGFKGMAILIISLFCSDWLVTKIFSKKDGLD